MKYALKTVYYLILFLPSLAISISCDRLEPVNPHYEDYFLKYYGNDGNQEGAGIVSVPDGYILAGTTRSTGQEAQIYLVKTDKMGEVIWERNFGVANMNVETVGLVSDTAGNLYVAANISESSANHNIYLIKVGPQGDMIATGTYGFTGYNDEVNSITMNDREEIILTGFTTKVDPPAQQDNTDDIYTIRMSSDLVVFDEDKWRPIQGFEGRDVGKKIIQGKDSVYFVLGETNKKDDLGLTDKINLIFYMLSEDGRFPQGDRILGTINDDFAADIAPTSVNGCVIAGNAVNATGISQIYLIRADASGVINANEPLQSVGNARANGIVEAINGGYIILGERIIDNSRDLLLIKVDQNFQVEWQQSFGGLNDDFGSSVIQLDDGRILLTGTVNLESQTKMFLMKTQPNGKLQP